MTRTCGHGEAAMAVITPAYRWPDLGPVGVYPDIDAGAVGLTKDEVEAVFERVCAAWTSASALSVVVEPNPNKARVVAGLTPIDGPWNVMGLTDLPSGPAPGVMLLRLDSAGPWTAATFEETVLHELGHALGLGHAPQGSGAVMEPILTGNLTPQPSDVEDLRSRYGPRTSPAEGAGPGAPAAADPAGAQVLRFHAPAAGDYELVVSVRPARLM